MYSLITSCIQLKYKSLKINLPLQVVEVCILYQDWLNTKTYICAKLAVLILGYGYCLKLVEITFQQMQKAAG